MKALFIYESECFNQIENANLQGLPCAGDYYVVRYEKGVDVVYCNFRVFDSVNDIIYIFFIKNDLCETTKRFSIGNKFIN